jgi:uncharacterized protein (DUF1800 family)
MNTRRSWIARSAAATAVAALSSCERTLMELERSYGNGLPGSLAVATGREIDPDFHLLSRASFGPWPGELERLRKMGRSAWIEEQLKPESITDTVCDLRSDQFESRHLSAGDAYEFRKNVIRDELTRFTLLRAIYSKRQLFEVMVEFWTDHLNIDQEKNDCAYLKPSDDRDVIRQHAMGKFPDLIRASATSPAMLVYLDGKNNKVRNAKDAPNENYARELMELHTLGVHGGYTQQDVREAARCLSGWTFDRNRMTLDASYGYFRKDWHDDGAKVVLGQNIASGGGAGDIESLVRIVCQHPSTANYIALKLCRRFVSPTPAQRLVDEVAQRFTSTGGDIREMLRCILQSSEFAQSAGLLFKRPLRYLVSLLRATGAETHAQANGQLVQALQRMGQSPFQHPTPDGYPEDETPWMGTLLWRWNFALNLAAGKLQPDIAASMTEMEKALGTLKWNQPEKVATQWLSYLTGRAPTTAELGAMKLPQLKDAAARAELLGLVMSSPAFQRY